MAKDERTSNEATWATQHGCIRARWLCGANEDGTPTRLYTPTRTATRRSPPASEDDSDTGSEAAPRSASLTSGSRASRAEVDEVAATMLQHDLPEGHCTGDGKLTMQGATVARRVADATHRVRVQGQLEPDGTFEDHCADLAQARAVADKGFLRDLLCFILCFSFVNIISILFDRLLIKTLKRQRGQAGRQERLKSKREQGHVAGRMWLEQSILPCFRSRLRLRSLEPSSTFAKRKDDR